MALNIDVDYSDTDIQTKFKRPTSGKVYHLRVKGRPENGISTFDESLTQKVTYACLRESGQESNLTYRETMSLPFVNPQSQKTQQTDRAFPKIANYLHAVYPDQYAAWPPYDREAKQFLDPQGAPIQNWEEHKKEICRPIQKEMKQRWESDGAEWQGEEHFALIDDNPRNPKYQTILLRFSTAHEAEAAGFEVDYTFDD